jgi:hypothetical protein
MKKAAIFEETYRKYLSELHGINFSDCVTVLGIEIDRNGLTIPFFNEKYKVSTEGIENIEGRPTPFAVKVVLCRYILMCPGQQDTCQPVLVSYREFKDSAPLVSYFTSNTSEVIEQTYTGRLGDLLQKCLSAGGVKQHSTAYDLSFTFQALPRISIVLNFNDQDNELPAKCSLLFYSNAQYYLDMECLAITATYLTKLLL